MNEVKKPLVSVIMPVYNGAPFVRQAAESALRQSMGDLELIIVDDCSTDGSAAIIARLAQMDSRIRPIYAQANAGVAASRNIGLNTAKGDFTAFLDCDDIWLPNKLELQLARMREMDADICYASYSFINKSGEPVGRPYIVPEKTDYRSLLYENVIGCSTALFRRSSLGGLRMDGNYMHEDYVFWLEALKIPVRAAGIRDVLVKYRLEGRSSNKIRAARERWRIYRRAQGLGLLSSALCFIHYAARGAVKRIPRR